VTVREQTQLPNDGWAQHAKEQRRAWLALSYRERLRWLEQAKLFYRRARQARKRRVTPP